MILKNFELNKINLNKNKIILLHGKNEGFKNEALSSILKDLTITSNYEEKEILDNATSFIESISSKSLFENRRTISIKRATDKILKIVEEINSKDLDDIIILNSGNLEKKSKLRSFFEKDKKNISIAFYPDNEQTLSKLCLNYLKGKKIPMSQSTINLIINKCAGDRGILLNELNKITLFSKKGKKLNSENITKLINLSEDYSISELIDNCLAKKQNKTINILNENNFNNEDCILILRVMLNKAKKILELSKEYNKNNNIELTISTAKPPIFWKDKEITKQQIYKWKPDNIKKLIYELSQIELILKKNILNAVNLTSNFLLEQSSSNTNN